MESRGIIRRVDELGRIVLPREMRKMLNVKEGSRLEISIVEGDKFLLTKYSPVATLKDFSESIIEAISTCVEHEIYVTDTESILSSNIKKNIGKRLTVEAQELISKRDLVIKKECEGASLIKVIEDDEKNYICELIVPIIKDGDVLGAIIVLGVEDKCFDTDAVKICKCFGKLLADSLA